jgi:micrococcal nuclease
MEYVLVLLVLASIPLILIGLIKPQIVLRTQRIEATRKNVLKIYGGLMVTSFIAFGFIAPEVPESEEKKQIAQEEQTVEILEDQIKTPNTPQEEVLAVSEVPTPPQAEVVKTDEPLPALASEKEEEIKTEEPTQETPSKQYYSVVRIVDGDTIVLAMDGQNESIRLIGINTPETKDPRKPVQCYGQEATSKAQELLSGQEVILEIDPTQGEVDKYGRKLGYIKRKDGLFFNFEMIKQGYAYEYTYNTPYRYQESFKNGQREAQQAQRGLWSPDTCNGELTAVTDSETEQQESTDTTKNNNIQDNSIPKTAECNIKGNISLSSGEKIYHYPSCPSYSRTKIDESKGERWFCSAEEAQQAGWRVAGNCRQGL